MAVYDFGEWELVVDGTFRLQILIGHNDISSRRSKYFRKVNQHWVLVSETHWQWKLYHCQGVWIKTQVSWISRCVLLRYQYMVDETTMQCLSMWNEVLYNLLEDRLPRIDNYWFSSYELYRDIWSIRLVPSGYLVSSLLSTSVYDILLKCRWLQPIHLRINTISDLMPDFFY